jgi:mannose-1-phosphate guanylyltransferase
MIMAGGSGTRLWPMSRRDRPKQLLPFIGGKTLLELAVTRLEGVLPLPQRLICTAESSRTAIRELLPDFTDEQIVGEPAGRDTVNAVGVTAAILAKRDPKAIFLVMTADHLIEPQEEFRKAVELGFSIVEDDPSRFVTFAITPTYPSTSYGYVERGESLADFPGAFRAKRFVEKPQRPRAEEYLAAGTFSWNSGMFVFGAAAFLKALEQFMPENHKGLHMIAKAWGTPERDRVLDEVYPNLPRKSVDFAVMEPAAHGKDFPICIVPMRVSWLDVGSWPSFGETLRPDVDANRTNARAAHVDSHGVLAISEDPQHTIATLGCRDLIIVHTPDATLVCPRGEAERLKELIEKIDPSLR